MYYPLSDKDVVKVAGDGTRVFMYARLPENIDNLINDRNPNAIILYESQRDENGDSYGHWCSVNKIGNDVNFFDSYGGKIDSQLSDIPLMFRKTSNQLRNKLSEMMANSNYNINYNEHKYQQYVFL